MYYELYIDSLFFVDFIMNFLLLCLANRIKGRTATGLRCIAGAAYGAGIYCLAFIIPVLYMELRLMLGCLLSIIGMIRITFKCKDLRQILNMMFPMTGAIVFLGGIFFLLKQKAAYLKNFAGGIFGTILLGVFAYLISKWIIRKIKKPPQVIYKVELETDNKKISVDALIDTGNSLVEPISGKPVAVLDKDSVRCLFGGRLPEYYRIVPYTSIGKKGLLQCFEIPKAYIEIHDEKRVFENVFIACADEMATKRGYMIINPRLIDMEEYI